MLEAAKEVIATDQQKIGRFFKALRKENNLTQEQLAERLGVSNRSVSRWETGNNLPDLDLLIQIADMYDVDLRELLNGERERTAMTQEMREAVRGVAEYSNYEKSKITRRIHWIFLAGIACFVVYLALDIMGLADTGAAEPIASAALGVSFGVLLVGGLYTSRFFPAIQKAKRKLFQKD